MSSTLRAVAETRFAAIARREDTVLSEIEAERQRVRDNTARLKALRLAATAAQAAKLAAMRKA